MIAFVKEKPESPDRFRLDGSRFYEAYGLFFHFSTLLATSSKTSSSLSPSSFSETI